MKSSQLLKIGIAGLTISALCCFTPLLVIILGTIGLTAWVAHLDAVLIPALLLSLMLITYAFIHMYRGRLHD
ncbi:MAG: mercury resistance system transport protein MerF [Mariprofundaceae bacterium]|nr:mercury resistance system transport protein MerF [Mariprofundaceae bacterium]